MKRNSSIKFGFGSGSAILNGRLSSKPANPFYKMGSSINRKRQKILVHNPVPAGNVYLDPVKFSELPFESTIKPQKPLKNVVEQDIHIEVKDGPPEVVPASDLKFVSSKLTSKNEKKFTKPEGHLVPANEVALCNSKTTRALKSNHATQSHSHTKSDITNHSKSDSSMKETNIGTAGESGDSDMIGQGEGSKTSYSKHYPTVGEVTYQDLLSKLSRKRKQAIKTKPKKKPCFDFE